jgi:hypothetical protein
MTPSIECRDYLNVMLSVFMLNITLLIVVVPVTKSRMTESQLTWSHEWISIMADFGHFLLFK